jgi:hypothetical protein
MNKVIIEEGETISESQQVQMQGCNAVVFVNQGDEVVTVGGRKIPVYVAGMQEYPSICYYGLEMDQFQRTLNVVFAGGGSGPALLVIRKKYE